MKTKPRQVKYEHQVLVTAVFSNVANFIVGQNAVEHTPYLAFYFLNHSVKNQPM